MGFHEKHEAARKDIRKANESLLTAFEASLKSSGLTKATINKHIHNISFYINEFLLYEDAVEAKDGVRSVSMFLGYWFIRKAMWASQASIKGNASSIKKFYTFLAETDLVDKDDLDVLRDTIKEEMPAWLAKVKRYG